MASGTVKWFDEKKGFGFIAQEGGGPDVFVHHSVIEGSGFKTLVEGEPLEFQAEVTEEGKGPRATRVIRLEPPAVKREPNKSLAPARGNLSGFLADAMGKKTSRSQLRGGLD